MKTIESTESAVFNALCDNGGNMSFNELMQDTGLDGERLSSIVRSLITNGQVLLRVNPLSVIANPCKSRAEVICNRFMELLYEHYREERNVTFYASKLCVTPKYLSAIVKEYSGKTPYKWIEETVMDEICRLLRQTGESVKTIAYDLNFSNVSFFGKFVKRHVGMSPVQYRRMGK